MAKKILIIEDEEIISTLLQNKLAKEGFNVVVAINGEDGLQQMKAARPDLVLLDIIMPQKDGFQVMEEMHRDEKLAGIPVIIISNSGQPVELSRAKELGVKDWLVKTEFDPQEVIAKVIKQIGQPN